MHEVSQAGKVRNFLRVERLRGLREKRGLTQRAFADLCGMSQTQIFRYEGGHSEPSVESLAMMAQVLGVSADYLIGLSDDPGGYSAYQLTEDEGNLLNALRNEGWFGALKLSVEGMKEEVQARRAAQGEGDPTRG
jgi:transcriptional regulator with XRE-family HTH domain